MNEAQIVKKIEELLAKKKPIEKRLIESYKELETLYEERDKIRLKKMTKDIDPEFVLIPEHESMIMYNEADRQVRELGLYKSGYAAKGRYEMEKLEWLSREQIAQMTDDEIEELISVLEGELENREAE